MNYIERAEEKLRLIHGLQCFQGALKEELSNTLVNLELVRKYKNKIEYFRNKLYKGELNTYGRN